MTGRHLHALLWLSTTWHSWRSVLEAGRSLTLAEKGGDGAEEIVAAPEFRLVATMNPGGDYGKRELSAALANRFTTVWVPAFRDLQELGAILRSQILGERRALDQGNSNLGRHCGYPNTRTFQVLDSQKAGGGGQCHTCQAAPRSGRSHILIQGLRCLVTQILPFTEQG